MTESPQTAREYAYVHITGPGSHEAITECLGMVPSEAGNVGDINPATGRPYRILTWKVVSGLDDTHGLTEHISSLLLIFRSRSRQLRELWVDYHITLECVGFYPTSRNPGVHFDREVVRQAAQLGMAIDCDFYIIECGDDG